MKPGVFAAVARRDLEDGRMTFTADRDSGEVAIWSGGARIGVVNRESVELASTSSSVLDEVVGALRRSDADGYVECFTCLSRITAKAWQTVGQKMPVLCGSCADDRGITR